MAAGYRFVLWRLLLGKQAREHNGAKRRPTRRVELRGRCKRDRLQLAACDERRSPCITQALGEHGGDGAGGNGDVGDAEPLGSLHPNDRLCAVSTQFELTQYRHGGGGSGSGSGSGSNSGSGSDSSSGSSSGSGSGGGSNSGGSNSGGSSSGGSSSSSSSSSSSGGGAAAAVAAAAAAAGALHENLRLVRHIDSHS